MPCSSIISIISTRIGVWADWCINTPERWCDSQQTCPTSLFVDDTSMVTYLLPGRSSEFSEKMYFDKKWHCVWETTKAFFWCYTGSINLCWQWPLCCNGITSDYELYKDNRSKDNDEDKDITVNAIPMPYVDISEIISGIEVESWKMSHIIGTGLFFKVREKWVKAQEKMTLACGLRSPEYIAKVQHDHNHTYVFC